jgi:leader peptidase (prepilin peptidase)/N-methyltransferase
MTQTIYAIAFLLLGLIIGSFLNVCAYRIPRKESVAYPASHCTSCGKPIRPFDNIPLISYLTLRGKCRDCGERIGLRYPVVEGMVGLLWMAAYLQFGLSYRLAAVLFFVTVVVLLSVIDIDTKTVPNTILLPSIALSLALASLYVINVNLVPVYDGYNGFWAFGGLLAGGGFLLIVAMVAPLVFKKEAMGAGDVKLAAFAGLYLGGYVLLALFLSFLIGSIVSIALIVMQKTGKRDEIPFAPFIGAGSIIAVFFGPQVWAAYLGMAGLA